MSASESVQSNENFYIYQYWQQSEGCAGQRISVIYVARNSPRDAELVRLIRRHLELTYEPHRIVLIGTTHYESTILRLSESDDVRRTPTSIAQSAYGGKIEVATISSDGNIHSIRGSQDKVWSDSKARELFAAGLALMFMRNGAVLDSRGQGFHFVAPSGRHQSTFIRVGNVFASGSQTSFAASALLRLVPPGREIESIYVDSSTIGVVAYELAIQLCELRNLTHRPVVSSFAGYAGLETADQPMPNDRSLVLISFSATGRLSQLLRKRLSLSSETPIVNIYSDGDLQPVPNAACYLDRDNGVGEELHLGSDSVDPERESCPECQRDSSKLVIAGDQLLPLSPRTRLAEIKPAHAPAGLVGDMEDLIRYEAIRVNVRYRSESGYTREIHLDLEALASKLDAKPSKIDGSLLKGARQRIMDAASPNNHWIIHTDDAVSMKMADVIRVKSNSLGARMNPENVLSAREFLKSVNRPQMGTGKVVVTAGAIASGRTLEILSEVLRSVHAGGVIHYVVLFARSESESAWKRTTSNLKFGQRGANSHELTAPQHIEMAPLRKDRKNAWELEASFWHDVIVKHAGTRILTRDQLALVKSRLNQIKYFESPSPGATPGIRNTLFLAGLGSPSLATEEDKWHLNLQPNFSFWKFGYTTLKVTQADVFLTFSAVLNRMRNRDGNRGALIDQTHDRTCIDPADFSRYSDGVAQAAILRSARPVELDYSNNFELSQAITTILERLAVKPHSNAGNALPEFLLAIAMGTLRLHPRHHSQLSTILEQAYTSPLGPSFSLLISLLRRPRAHD